MHGAILAAQILKIIAGLAQLGFAVLLFFRAPRSPVSTTVAISFGANGLAYALWNLALPGQRTAGTSVLEGRAEFNWIATVAMLAFAVLFVRGARG